MSPPRLPFHLLTKPAGAACNLRCKYCFFLSKEGLYAEGESALMTEGVLETCIRELMEASPGPTVEVSWQGGEPLLRGIDFYRRSVELAEKYRKPHQRVTHSIQTNGTLIDDDWAAFFKLNHYLVGLSLDGPREIHDAFRVDSKGDGSFDEVMRGWRCLQRHAVDVNVLCTIHAANAHRPLDVYRFFRDELQAQYIQLIPIVERATPETIGAANQGWGGLRGKARPLYRQQGELVTERSVTPDRFGRFLSRIFDEWVRRDVGKVFVTTFEVAIGSWNGEHNLCLVAPTCGQSLTLEHNGDVYSCDHFVEPGHRLGNIRETPLRRLVESEQQRRFGLHKFESLPKYCRDCPVLFVCHGECPRNRFARTPDGESGLNYLCAGYRAFFTHIDRPMKQINRLLREGRNADQIMRMR